MREDIIHAFDNGDYRISFTASGAGRVWTTARHGYAIGSVKLLDENDILELEVLFAYAASRIRGRRKGKKDR